MTTAAEPQNEAENTEALSAQPSTSLVRSAAASIGFGLSAANWDEGLRIARTLANSEMIPTKYQGHPEDVVVAMQYGAEVGLAPMASLQSIAVINGRPALWGDGFLGVIMASRHYQKHVEYYVTPAGEQTHSLTSSDLNNDLTKAVSMFWRRGIAEPFIGEFSIADAKRAKLLTKDGPWQTYPARQLLWRARGFAGRNGFAPELRGIKIITELLDTPEEEFIDADPAPQPRAPIPIRRSEKVPAPEPAVEEPPEEPILTPPEPKKPAPPAAPAGKPAKPPAPAGKPAKSANPQPEGPTVLESLVITDTAYVQPKGAAPFYEVRATVQAEGKAPIGYVLITRDEALYQLAQSAEGTPQLFRITFHRAKRPDGSDCKVLDAIAAS
jgi:hypothetical protein